MLDPARSHVERMHRTFETLTSWLAILAVTVPLAAMLLASLPTGALAQIAMHVVLLVAGAALVLALHQGQ